jgi:hypothetical protein
MSRRRYQQCGGIAACCLGALALSGLAGCESSRTVPQERAQDFIETLVSIPVDTQKLRDVAHVAPERNPEDLLDGLPARVAVDFLRAKHSQGADLVFSQSDARQISATQRMVTVRVSYLQPGAPADSEARFQVQIEKDHRGQWQIARVTGDN